MGKIRKLTLAVFFLGALFFATATVGPKIVHAATSCSCLVYFQRATGLPATGNASFSAQNYASWLKAKKNSSGQYEYNVTYLTPNTASPSS